MEISLNEHLMNNFRENVEVDEIERVERVEEKGESVFTRLSR